MTSHQPFMDGKMSAPIKMLLWCPQCSERHIDEGTWATKPHHTHACQKCGMVWRPSVECTVGVRFLPNFNNVVLEAPLVTTIDRDNERAACISDVSNALHIWEGSSEFKVAKEVTEYIREVILLRGRTK